LTIWTACSGPEHIKALAGTLLRLVESQEQVATSTYVDTLEEQALLEFMLEDAKPASPFEPNTPRLHYLLKTPFRYPPLPWGSRFGRRHETGIFYGGKDLGSTLAESAYYRFVFWFSMSGTPVKNSIRTSHTLFTATYHTPAGIQLQLPPFAEFRPAIAHPADYTATQQLGSAMRESGVEAFEYPSARDPAQGTCVGVFKPAAFSAPEPEQMHQWLCAVSATEVTFKALAQPEVHRFALEHFLVEGNLPRPSH
jgi:hypothetical protein